MRSTTLLVLLLLVTMPAAGSTEGPVPTMTLRLEPGHMMVNSSVNEPVSATFNGTVDVREAFYTSTTVSLTSSVDRGWASQVSPSSLVFPTSGSQEFTVTVVVPQGTNGTGTITVEARGVTRMFVVSGAAQAVLDVMNSTLGINQTHRPSASGGGGGARTAGLDPPMLAAVAATIGLVAGVTGLFYTRRVRKRRSATA